MTVVAYDGKTIAEDKQGTLGQTSFTTTKLFKIRDNLIIGLLGSLDRAMLLMNWYLSGAEDAAFPPPDKDEKAELVVLANGVLGVCFGDVPVFHEMQDIPFSFGSGDEVALGAMKAGATAVEAVAIACESNIYCGRGIDSFPVVIKPVKKAKKGKK